jgi:hypothetical protein
MLLLRYECLLVFSVHAVISIIIEMMSVYIKVAGSIKVEIPSPDKPHVIRSAAIGL